MTSISNQLVAEDVPCTLRGIASSSTTDELTLRRDLLVEEGRSRPVERLAAFLLFLSRDEVYSGGDGIFIADGLRCSIVAELLKFSMLELECYLLALQRMGLVLPLSDGRLQIIDVTALEKAAAIGQAENRS